MEESNGRGADAALDDYDSVVYTTECYATSLRGKGKRGGFRVVYIDLPWLGRTYLLKLYSKDEQDDLSSEQKRELKRIATELTSEDIQ